MAATRWLAGWLLSAVAAQVAAADLAPLQVGLDYHSFANVEAFRVRHVDIDLRIDFDDRTLRGEVGLEIERLDPRATQLVLDTQGLVIHEVTQKAARALGASSAEDLAQSPWSSRPFRLDRPDPILGSALVIDLPPSRRSREYVRIDYETSPAAAALGWLPAKRPHARAPLLYVLPGPISARSWLPLQDTPQSHFSYRAVIHAPEGARVLMSGANDPRAKADGRMELAVYEEVTASQLALVAGDLEFRATGPRSGVYAEKRWLRQGAAELANTEAMLHAAESTLGGYRFGRFDAVVVGEELPVAAAASPGLALVSATLLTGDHSALEPVASALIDAWTFASAFPASWRDAWIDEAVDGYLGRRIFGAAYGETAASLDALVADERLRSAPANSAAAARVLAADLRGRDPASAVDSTVRAQGAWLLASLEAAAGRDAIDACLRRYLERFAGANVTTEQFLDFLVAQLPPGHGADRAELDRLVFHAALPASGAPSEDGSWRGVDAARTAWLADAKPLPRLVAADWHTPQWMRFIEALPPTLPAARAAELDAAVQGLGGNRLVESAWLDWTLRAGYAPALPSLERFLTGVGRGSLVEPKYRQAMRTPAGAALARRVYAGARSGYHPSVAAVAGAIVEPAPEDTDAE